MRNHRVEHAVGRALKILTSRSGRNAETLGLDLDGHGHLAGHRPHPSAETNVADPADGEFLRASTGAPTSIPRTDPMNLRTCSGAP
jgi:hypothetical protein